MMRWVCCLFSLALGIASLPLAIPAPAEEGEKEDAQADGESWRAERRELNEKAARAFAEGDWQEANHVYQKILQREPDNPLILANLGAVEYQLDDLRACCHYLERALALKGDLVASREMLGMAYHRREKPLRAVSALSRAVADQPESARTHNQLAVVLQSMGWFDGAEKSLRQAIQLDPEFRDAHFNLALVYMERQPPSVELAKRHYQRARLLGVPKDAELERQLGLEEGVAE